MQSISTPLNAMHEDGAWFARAHELRLWLVRCDGNLRKPIVTLVPKLEFHADNFSAWPLLVDAHVAGGPDPGGWQVRANVLAACEAKLLDELVLYKERYDREAYQRRTHPEFQPSAPGGSCRPTR